MMTEKITCDVTCGVAEEGKHVILVYKVPDPIQNITWEWNHEQHEDGASHHTAQMVAHISRRGHMSKPVPDEVFKKLGSPKKKKEGAFFKVKMSRKDVVSIEQYFNG